ncbi:MAG: hypothetical protein HQM06_06900 [Magnetococcales bacterium]|nr:hypothetical protein [Magnetococcales bacterium]
MPDWLLPLLNHPGLPWNGALLIAAWALYEWWLLVKRSLNPVYQQLRQQLSAHERDPAASLALFYPPEPVQKQSTPSIPPPLSLSGLLGSSWEQRHLQDIPNRLLGLGLFFTLLGLLAALASVSRELHAGSLQEAKEALQTILQVALWKFITSLSGLCSAALYGRIARGHQKQLAQQLANLQEQLQEQVAYRAERAAAQLPQATPPIPVPLSSMEQTTPPPEAALPSETAPPSGEPLPTATPAATVTPATTAILEPHPVCTPAPSAVASPLAHLAGAFLHDQQQRRARSLVKPVRPNA